jgi:hypothetical protein
MTIVLGLSGRFSERRFVEELNNGQNNCQEEKSKDAIRLAVANRAVLNDICDNRNYGGR